jgi:3-deoxy-D-manno-octulosonic-acid transferase
MTVEADTEFFPGQSTLSRQVLIAGSTYSEDERVLLDTYKLLQQNASETLPHLILVPHEPTNERVHQIRENLNLRGFSHSCFSELTEGVNLRDTDVIIIDTIGLLAKLYLMGDVAFVGGSFHGSVHNVMEPAAMAKPVLFGPTVHNAYEAHVLQHEGAARLVNNAAEMASVLRHWLNDPKERIRRGAIAKRVIEENLGAAERTLTHLRAYLR